MSPNIKNMYMLFYRQAVCKRSTKVEKGLLKVEEQ